MSDFPKVQRLKSVDNIYIVSSINYFKFHADDKEANLEIFKESVVNASQMGKCLDAWKEVTRFPGKMYPTMEDYEIAMDTRKAEKEIINNDEKVAGAKTRGCDPAFGNEDDVLSFRVTCERTGTHNFESSIVACVIGGELQDLYNWIVDLTSYQLEILCKITHGMFHLNRSNYL